MKQTTIRLGLMAPLTGLVSLYGQEISWAARIACDEVNEGGGILGQPLELIIVDDGSLPESAVPAANALIDKYHCLALIGNLLSNSRIAVASMVAESRHIPYLNFSFYEGSICNPYFFHFAALPNQQIDYMIPYMAQEFGPKMFFAGSNYEWPHGSIDAAKEVLRRKGGEILGEEYLEIGTQRIHKLLDAVSRSGADVFVPYFAGQDQVNLLTQFTTMGLKKRMAVVMGHYDEAMASKLPPLVREGFFSSNTYFMSLNTQANHNYLQKLAKLEGITGIWPEGNGMITNFGEGTYLCVHAYAQAVNQAGSLNTAAIISALRHIQVTGLQGNVTMDPDIQHAHVNSYLSQCNADGMFPIVKHFGCQPPRIPERYQGVIINHSANAVLMSPNTVVNTVIPSVLHPMAVLDDDARLIFFNYRFTEIFAQCKLNIGMSARELWEQPVSFDAAFVKVKQGTDWQGKLLIAGVTNNSQPLMLALESAPTKNKSSATYLLYCFPADLISLPQQDDPFKHIFDIAGIAIIAVDETGVIQQVNHGACTLFGYTIGELLGLSVHLLLPPHLRSYHVQAMSRFVNGHQPEIAMGRRGEISGYRKDGSIFPASASIAKFNYHDSWMLVVTLQDISEQKRAEDDMVWRANHDPLTGLANRALISERLTNALQRTRRTGFNVALLFVDLDNFKLINDTFGHSAGDQVLIRVAEILSANVSAGDIICRLGGDEYVVLCDQVEEPEQIIFLAQRLNEALRTSIMIKGTEIYLTASIGLAFGHGSTHSADDLLRESDAAMYVTKEQGRDSYRVFSDKVHALAQQRLIISNGLRHALERNEFSLQYQPIVVANNGYICGAEALLRWNSPSGPISPAVFIPIAESTGVIVAIGEWVFREACRTRTRLQNIFNKSAPYISVNVSTRQLNEENLVNNFARIMAEEQTDAHAILVEITETSLMSDVEMNLRMLRGLSDLGLEIAVDDFGTGYSSLLQLLRMPVSTIKIDREFINGLDKRQDSRTITAAIARMSASLGKKVIAEGVENEIQQLELINLEVDYLQGFLFSRPIPENELIEKIRSQQAVKIPQNIEVYYVIYVSEAVMTPSKDDLSIILQKSREFNKNYGVTGLLIYSSGCFMQMLEGREEIITDLMTHIAMDSRHRNVQKIVSGNSKYRLFQNWEMRFWNMELNHDEGPAPWRKINLDLMELAKNISLCMVLFEALSRGVQLMNNH